MIACGSKAEYHFCLFRYLSSDKHDIFKTVSDLYNLCSSSWGLLLKRTGLIIIGTFRLEYEYEIEYEYDFSNFKSVTSSNVTMVDGHAFKSF